jgi:hypothetical protein
LDNSLLKELSKKNVQTFSYYAGSKGVRTIYWNSKERKINEIQVTSR